MKYELSSVSCTFNTERNKRLFLRFCDYTQDHPVRGRLMGISLVLLSGATFCLLPIISSVEATVKGIFILIAALFSKKYSFSDAGQYLKDAVVMATYTVPSAFLSCIFTPFSHTSWSGTRKRRQ